MKCTPLTLIAVALLLAFAPAPARAVNPTIGFLGDSNTDEYRSNDNRAANTPYADTTLSWAELLINHRSLDAGEWGEWGEPRRSGYAYNWSRSGATTESMIAEGQHTGLAEQVAEGEVEFVVIWIGTNDFNSWNNTYREVYDGTLDDKQLDAKIDSIVDSITTAVDTLQAAGDPNIVLANFPDPGQTILAFISFPSSKGRQRVSDAIAEINTRLDELASSRGIVLADVASFGSTLVSRIDATGSLVVGGESINTLFKGNEPHHLQLNDSAGHIGTVGSGLLANFFIKVLNENYGLSLEPFTDAEILANAGIAASS